MHPRVDEYRQGHWVAGGAFLFSTLPGGLEVDVRDLNVEANFSMSHLFNYEEEVVVLSSTSLAKQSLVIPILVGGFAAGSLDLASAFLTYGWGVPRAIASGLLGRQALHAGMGTWILGVFLHFFIAYSAATIYCLASRKLDFLKPHFLVCGMFYGIAVFLVMYLIVLPLSARHSAGPYQLRALIQGILVHMFLIGVPIGFCLYRFGIPNEIR
jgi:hypothetical protein